MENVLSLPASCLPLLTPASLAPFSCQRFSAMFAPMTKNIPALLLGLATLLLCSVTVSAAPQTMRVDYYHTGNSKQEVFSVDRIQIEPLPWPGDMSKTIDDSNLGKYFFEVRDQATKRVLYSRGFASIFGEWETTDEATTMMRTFSESLRFPAPGAPVEIVLKKRDAKNTWRDIWTTNLDPKDMFIDRSKVPAPAP